MMARIERSSCENPQFPSWVWRYNRNKHLSRFEPGYTRVEQWPPQYRNMGMHNNFRFHPVSAEEVGERPFQALGVNYAHHLRDGRAAGFGNAALGHTPGPAPPRLVLYNNEGPHPVGDLYPVNSIHNISPGMSLHGNTPLRYPSSADQQQPLNPRQYAEQTLGQPAAIPGSFPHFNAPARPAGNCVPRECRDRSGFGASRNPLEIWRAKNAERTRLERATMPPPLLYC